MRHTLISADIKNFHQKLAIFGTCGNKGKNCILMYNLGLLLSF